MEDIYQGGIPILEKSCFFSGNKIYMLSTIREFFTVWKQMTEGVIKIEEMRNSTLAVLFCFSLPYSE